MKSVSFRFLLPFGLVVVLFSAFVIYRSYALSQRHAHELLSQQAALAMEFNLAIRDYAAEQIRPVMDRLVGKDDFIPETMSTSFISRHIFDMVRKKFPDSIIHFASDDPRNPINKANADELRMIEYFRRNPQSDGRTEEVRIEGRRYLARFTPKWMKEECLRCHGDPKDAPAALIKQYGAKASFQRKVGDVVALDTVAVPLDAMNSVLAAEIRWQSLILAAGLIILFGAVMGVFRSVVTRRLGVMAGHIHEIASHPESARLTPLEVSGNDEISLVGTAFNKLVEQLRGVHASLEQQVSQRTAELARTNEELKREIAEKEVLLKEVHHRVKNNLQIVSSLLGLQASQVENPLALEVLRETKNRVRSMALIHETLYSSESLERVNFATYVEHLCAYLASAFGVDTKRIQLISHIADADLELDQAVPCGLIINELVSNALKHAFPGERAGQITVELWTEPDGRRILRVADDGAGLPRGLDFRKTDTLGLRLVGNLADQLDGTLALEQDGGTAFCVTFNAPVQPEHLRH